MTNQFKEKVTNFIESINNLTENKREELKKSFLNRNDLEIMKSYQWKQTIKHHIFPKELFPINVSHFSKKYWLACGYSEEESNEKIFNIQSKLSNRAHEKIRKNPEKYVTSNSCRIDYWLAKGYSQEEAAQKLKERQTTFSLDRCISKYGEEIGKKIWKERQLKWQKSLYENNDMDDVNKRKGRTKEQWIATNGEDSWKDLCSKKAVGAHNASQESMIYFGPLKEKLICAGVKDDEILFGDSKNNRREKRISSDKGIFFYDFTVESLKIIIEFHGIKWHAKSPTDSSFYPIFDKTITASDCYYRDLYKKQLAESQGYNFFSVFSDEENILDKMIQFIQNKHPEITL